MDYQEALAFIHSIARFGSKPGLRRVSMLLERMDAPQRKLKFIHVAGTNGKGSTCAMLNGILRQAGYRTGLYISPFVLDFRERIQLDGKMISKRDLADCTRVVKAHWDELDAMGETPTEFEVVVAVAMEYFTRMCCDIVVLEVGMGGRFDATNVIDAPLCSVITAIGMDHMEYLGDTLEKIAAEKCGIIKRGGVTVSYPLQDPEALAVIMEQCALMENRLLIPGAAGVEILEMGIEGSRVRWEEREYRIPLAGKHQIYNTLTVLEAVKAISLSGFSVPYNVVFEGIATTCFPARLEILGREPLVLLDGAHNLQGVKALGAALDLLPQRPVHLVMGVLADKEVDAMLAELLPRCADLLAVAPDNPRGLPAKELAGKARAHCPAEAVPDLREAVRRGLARCERGEVLLLCGSLYLASQLRPLALEMSKHV